MNLDQPAMKELDEVPIHPELPDHIVHIRAQLSQDIQERLIEFLKQHHECFVWSHMDMTGIDLEVIVHQL